MRYLIAILLGYGLGCINPAYLLGILKGFDIRSKGTHNAGASNAK
ncbi:MAG: glycerol-3-phosphate acyltransferase, partial [Erysipelotrichia bacterium]|nr:glycerol-3-phosphate acyltransferase [Erysipelotrichia bacterium]